MIDEYAIHIITVCEYHDVKPFTAEMEQMSYPQRTAYFNAIGYAAWENIFGIWQLGSECLTEVRLMDMMDMITLPVRYRCARNGISPRDGELLKRAMTILRHFHHVLSAAWQQLP